MKSSQPQVQRSIEAGEPARAGLAAQDTRAPSGGGALAGMIAQSPQAAAQRKLIASVNQSPRMVAQRRQNAVLQFAPTLYDPALAAATRTAKQAQGPAGHQIDATHMAHKGYHKINRIAGVLFPIGLMAPVVAPLQLAIAEINLSPVAAVALGGGAQRAAIRTASEGVLDQVIADPAKTVQQADECALLGPLDYWSNLGTASGSITARLRTLRFEMMQRARVSIIAHRAMGATNRSFGGLIPDNDPARTRPTENSPAAFATSLGYAAHAGNAGGIDGVECDVFLSSDGVAMLSHDSNIYDQMSAARRIAFAAAPPPLPAGETPHTAKIEHFDAATLGGMQRRVQAPAEAPDASAFMTLNGLLTAALAVAGPYAAHTGKAFRVEIEMKGHNVGAYNIVDVTAKTISRFKKANPASHDLEIVMFNGVAADVALHDAKRATKSRLGGLIVGLGGAPAPAPAAPDDRIDEYRGSLVRPAQVRVGAAAAGHVSTYVLGAESALLDNTPVGLLEWPLPPTVIPFITANLNTALTENAVYNANRVAIDAAIVAAIPPAAIPAPLAAVAPVPGVPVAAPPAVPPYIVAAIAAGRNQFTYTLRVERGRANHAAHLAAQQAVPNAPPGSTHVLTDFPERAAETRARITPPPAPPAVLPGPLPPAPLAGGLPGAGIVP